MNDDKLTDELAQRVMGFKVTPDRYIKSGRVWMPKWRFTPLTSLDDAFHLLECAADRFRLETPRGGPFRAEVRIAGQLGRASGEPKSRTITIALARALGMEVVP